MIKSLSRWETITRDLVRSSLIMNVGPSYSMPRGAAKYTTLCGVTSAAIELQSSAVYHICVLIPNHTNDHMCECGWEWHNQVGENCRG